MADYDPRIVDLYDEDNPDGPERAYYRAFADRLKARTVLDVGCGTGMLTVTLTAPSRDVVGIDPSSSMINFARRRPGSHQVTWIEGDTLAIHGGPFDLVVMTGNVSQHIPDGEWERTLGDLRRAANDGGALVFESRNPAARAWVGWAQPAPTTRETMHGPLREWCDVLELGAGQVQLRFHNHFEATDDTVVEELLLTFRRPDVLTAQLADAGFEVSAIWGDWNRTPFDGTQPIMVFEAHAV